MKKYYLIIITLLIIVNLISAFSVRAGWVKDIIEATSRGKVTGELIPEPCRIGAQPNVNCSQPDQTNCRCTITDLVTVGVNIAYLILGLIGTLALLMFVYGGIMFLISSGNQEKVTKAKSILVNAVIGIVIVFSAWLIVNFIIVALTQGQAGLGQTGTLFEGESGAEQPWATPPK